MGADLKRLYNVELELYSSLFKNGTAAAVAVAIAAANIYFLRTIEVYGVFYLTTTSASTHENVQNRVFFFV